MNINKADQQEYKPTQTKNTTTIGDKEYTIKLLKGSDSITMLNDLTKRVGPSIGAALDRLQHDPLDGSPTTFTEIMVHFVRNLDSDTLLNYTKDLLSGAKVNGQPLDIDVEFEGNMGGWIKLVAFALKENFGGSFGEGWEKKGQDLVAMIKSLSQQDSTQQEPQD